MLSHLGIRLALNKGGGGCHCYRADGWVGVLRGVLGVPGEQEGDNLGLATASEICLPCRDPSPACCSLTASCPMLL